MRTFQLHRDVDSSGVSGTGIVAEGVQFSNGKVVICWLTKYSSVASYDSLDIVEHVHGHGGNTRIVWTAQPYRPASAGGPVSLPLEPAGKRPLPPARPSSKRPSKAPK